MKINFKSYSGIKKSKIDPLLLFFGYKDIKLPNVKFDGDYYLNTYKDVRKSKVIPWYIIFFMARMKEEYSNPI